MAVVLLGTVGLLVGLSLLLVGPNMLGWVGLASLGYAVRWPLGLALLVSVLGLTYRVLPNRRHTAHWPGIAVGATVGAVLLGAVAVGLRIYLAYVANLDVMYGALAGPIVLLIWLYLTTMAVLIGAKLAAVLEARAGAAVQPATSRNRG